MNFAGSDVKIYQIILLSILLITGAIILCFLALKGAKRAKAYEFNGIIDKVYYEKPKNLPHIIIKGVDYDLFYLNYNDFDTISAGDSAIKLKGDMFFYLIKRSKSHS
jgi:hypothetical protein